MTEFPADRGEETRAKLRVRRMTAREQAIEAGAQADYDHDPKRMLCMDHDKQCCPSGDAHNMSHREARDHRVAAVLDAAELIIRANERERSYGDAYREGWTESRHALLADLRAKAMDLPSRVELDEAGNEVTWVAAIARRTGGVSE